MIVKAQNSSTATPSAPAGERRVGSDEDFSRDMVSDVTGAIDSMLARRTNARQLAGRSANCRRTGTPPTFTDPETDAASLAGIVNFPAPAYSRLMPSLHALQEWEGYVVETNDAEFTVRLTDLTAGAPVAGEEADIPLEEISDSDATRMQVESIFRWVIGYERSPTGTKKRVSQIVFRDVPAITKTDQRAGEDWANRISEAFGQ